MDAETNQLVESLRAQMYALTSRRERPLAATASSESARPPRTPFWLCETLKTQGVTAASDWDTTFNNQTYDRYIHGKVTGLGELPPTQVSDGNNRATRCRLLFESPQPFPFDALFCADTWGRLQYKLNNSPYVELTAETGVSFVARAGVNLFQVSIGTQAGYCSRVEVLCRILHEDAGVQWIDPYSLDLEGYPPPGGGSANNPGVTTGEV